jgi:hypothetical protein
MSQNTRSKRVTPKSGGRASKRRDRSPLLPAVVSVDTSDVDSVASIGSSGSGRSNIPKHILKQLFHDVEHAGGIQSFDDGLKQAVNILLDRGDPAIYGLRGDPVRKRLSNKVTQWKQLPAEKYHRKLYKLGLSPAASLPPKDIRKLKPKEKTPPRHRSPVPSIPEEVENESPEAVRPVHPKVRAREIATDSVTKQILESRSKILTQEKSPTEARMMRGTSPVWFKISSNACIAPCSPPPILRALLLAAFKPGNTSIIVDVGSDVTGDQGEGLYVFPITFKRNDVLHEGFELAVLCDCRDVAQDLYELHFKEGTNIARLTKPVLAAPFRMDKAELDLRILAGPGAAANQYIVDGRDASRVIYEKNYQKKGTVATKKTFEVLFDPSVKLSQRAFGHPVGKDDEWTIAVSLQLIHVKGVGFQIPARPATPALAARAAYEPDTFHSQITWRFSNSAKEQELVVAGARGAATVNAALAGL